MTKKLYPLVEHQYFSKKDQNEADYYCRMQIQIKINNE